MERFSISILRQQVYNICRLCGVDNPDKTLILGDEDVICAMESDEPTLAKKIEECVGIQVQANDQMPQSICSLCVDKVNDFYEYRLMCASTNIQTRTFLNLPLVQPSVSLMKSEPEPSAAETEQDDKSLATISTQKHGPKTRNRKKKPGIETPEQCAEDADLKSFLDVSSENRVKYEHLCQYCNEKYDQPVDLERHLVVKHTPLVHKFGCGSCMEYFDTASEYKDHNLWHKLTRTAFSCFRCGKKCAKIGTLNKHVEMNACIKRPSASAEVQLVPDMQCTSCQKIFKTRNLYEWHGCFIRARANCPKCGKYFLKKNLLIRHFMLYCKGSMPMMEPTYIPIAEPGINGPPVNGLPPPDSQARQCNTLVNKRGRGRPSRAERMKEETIELPFTPLLDLPEVKSEHNSVVDGQISCDEILSSEQVNEAQKRSSLIEQTDKITTLLRSGASVDGNTDIATISSMLSSVNEAIATISKVRKRKKKRDRDKASDEATEKANPPMVVLSMANVKQEVQEDPNGFVTLTNSSSVGNERNVPIPMDEDRQTSEADGNTNHDAEHCGDSDAGDIVEDSFADRADSDGDSSDVEIISVGTYHPTGTSNSSANKTQETGPLVQHTVQIKQEPMATDEGEESDFAEYEDASMFVAVKQEPSDESDATIPNQPCSTMEKHSNPSNSSYQALRIKIKKEKGLLNASVVEDGGTIDALRTPEAKRQKASEAQNKRSTRLVESGTKVTQPVAAKQHNLPPPAKRPRPSTAELMLMPIKQEPLESIQQLQEHVSTEQVSTADTAAYDPTMVRIKQEPLDDSTRSYDPLLASPSDIVAFDGVRIKQERVDSQQTAQQKSKKAFNPLSLIGVRLASSKKSTNSHPASQTAAQKSSVMINPFALLKQKEGSLPVVEEQTSSSEKEKVSTDSNRPERFSLPVITQVKSIDPVEHLSLTSVASAEAGPSSPEAEQLQNETSAGLNDCVDTNNATDTNSSPSGELNSDSSEPAVDTVTPKVTVSELKIASVTTIAQDVYDSNGQENTEQHMSTVVATTNNSDGNGNAAGTCSSEPAEKDLLPKLDSQDIEGEVPDDEMRQVEHQPKPSFDAEKESEDDALVVRMENDQQERSRCDIVAAENTSNIDTATVSNTVETLVEDKKDVNINASTTAKEDGKHLPDGVIVAAVNTEPPEPCAVADNDEVSVAAQQCTS
ncbi:dentin sialophosphoprotein [Anopheles maculipalpis]|uniref:dentin sialophosphoprotein n=1 Tax=Anopheles maculipalpis TaxID=1496333 RepID=UPI0021595678|nr:dentin sialophosphoprotein [Anopheles maculipalpis]